MIHEGKLRMSKLELRKFTTVKPTSREPMKIDAHGRSIRLALKMYSGRLVWPLDFRHEDLHLPDIVLGLSRANRFVGQTRLPVPVLWHSLNLSHAVPRKYALLGLVHDITEAYLVDLPRPLKSHPSFATYKGIEAKLFAQMCEALSLPFSEIPSDFEQIDHDIGTAEMMLFNPQGYQETLDQGFPLERHKNATKLANKIIQYQESNLVPRVTNIRLTKKIWMERYLDLTR